MDLSAFYFSILLKFDKKLEQSLNQAINKATQIDDELNPQRRNSMLADALGLSVLDSHSNQFTEKIENIKITFAYQLKCLALYPLKGEIFENWNKHVELFNFAERSDYSDESITKLHEFLQQLTGQQGESQFFTLNEIKNPFHNILLLIGHLDTLISLNAEFEPLCFNQFLKFRYNNDKSYSPSKSFSDILLFLLGSQAKKEFIQKIPNISRFEEWINPQLLDEELKASETEDEKNQRDIKNESFIKPLKQLIKKMREGNRFCYLTEIDLFFTSPFDMQKAIADPEFEKIAESNMHFLTSGNINKNDYLEFNDMNALWLIYFLQDYFYNFFKANNPTTFKQFSDSEDFFKIWKAFYINDNPKAIHRWPSEFTKVAKIN